MRPMSMTTRGVTIPLLALGRALLVGIDRTVRDLRALVA